VSAVTILHQGGLVVIMDRWTPIRCLELIERHRVTASMMVPTMLHRLVSLPVEERERYDLASLRPNGIMIGGARCPADTKAAMIDWWGPVFVESYGGSETTFSRISSEESRAHPGSVGRGRPGAVLRVLDDDGNDCPPGVVGTVFAHITDRALRPSYRNAPDKTAASYVGDAFTLGDMGYLDDAGWLYLVDRRSDLIVSGGANVYPAEVERVLAEHPRVDDVAVIGVPHDDWGHVVHALVVANGDADDALVEQLRDRCRSLLAAYKCPKAISFWPSLNRSEMGKLSRRKLRERFLASSTAENAAREPS
jgi:long-chain acyl-CoA synthetase